jgi:hypothetical protein
VPHASALHQPKKLGCPILRVVCEGRDDLTEQIDDICSRYPKYWLSDEAQRELQDSLELAPPVTAALAPVSHRQSETCYIPLPHHSPLPQIQNHVVVQIHDE